MQARAAAKAKRARQRRLGHSAIDLALPRRLKRGRQPHRLLRQPPPVRNREDGPAAGLPPAPPGQLSPRRAPWSGLPWAGVTAAPGHALQCQSNKPERPHSSCAPCMEQAINLRLPLTQPVCCLARPSRLHLINNTACAHAVQRRAGARRIATVAQLCISGPAPRRHTCYKSTSTPTLQRQTVAPLTKGAH